MFQIDLKNRKPIYEQVVDNFKKLIIKGILKDDDKVPSIRDMSKMLTVNPNTIQKAYRELERQGYFYTVHGQGTFISTPKTEYDTKEKKLLYDQLGEILDQLKFFGEKKEDVVNFMEKRMFNT